MERSCFLCKCAIEVIISQEWDLVALRRSRIGFGVCTKCGLILQSTTLPPKEMERYYRETAVYINPGRNGRPHKAKVKAVKRYIHSIIEEVGSIPTSVFQVGASDGYTLSEFRKAGAVIAEGVDPGMASSRLAKERYGVRVIPQVFETFSPRRSYHLLVLTHILEHMYNPASALRKCGRMQKEGDLVFVETPLFERIDRFGPGVLTLEHLNYFTERSLSRCLFLAGYIPIFVEEFYYKGDYPVITVLARKCGRSAVKDTKFASEYESSLWLLRQYTQQEKKRWGTAAANVKKHLSKNAEIYIWGAGIHTSQLFAFTNLKNYFRIKGLIDSSPTKWKKEFGGFVISNPSILQKGDAVVISSFASQEEIWKGLQKYRNMGIQVECFWPRL